MEFYRLSESHISRPRSAVEAAAYRAGECLEHNGVIYDYTKRRDIIHTEIVLPGNAPPEFGNRQTLWHAAENAEDNSTRRKTARTAHEILIAFPRVLTPKLWIAIARELIATCFESQGMVADLTIHCGDRKDAEHSAADHKEISPHNPHGHIMLSTRHVEYEGFSKLKAREWESWGKSDVLIGWRKEWAEIQNRMFERKGLNCWVTHEKRTNRERSENEQSHNEYEFSR